MPPERRFPVPPLFDRRLGPEGRDGGRLSLLGEGDEGEVGGGGVDPSPRPAILDSTRTPTSMDVRPV